MSARPTARPYETVSRKWREFAERRCAYFLDLHRSGRWKHYYTEEEFIARLRDVRNAAEIWAKLAPTASELAGGQAGPPSNIPPFGRSHPEPQAGL
jgi:uncharacterized repeat protein (TIGR03809 family)